VKITENEIPRGVIFSTVLLPRLS